MFVFSLSLPKINFFVCLNQSMKKKKKNLKLSSVSAWRRWLSSISRQWGHYQKSIFWILQIRKWECTKQKLNSVSAWQRRLSSISRQRGHNSELFGEFGRLAGRPGGVETPLTRGTNEFNRSSYLSVPRKRRSLDIAAASYAGECLASSYLGKTLFPSLRSDNARRLAPSCSLYAHLSTSWGKTNLVESLPYERNARRLRPRKASPCQAGGRNRSAGLRARRARRTLGTRRIASMWKFCSSSSGPHRSRIGPFPNLIRARCNALELLLANIGASSVRHEEVQFDDDRLERIDVEKFT